MTQEMQSFVQKDLSKNGPLLQHTHDDTEEVVDSVQSAT